MARGARPLGRSANCPGVWWRWPWPPESLRLSPEDCRQDFLLNLLNSDRVDSHVARLMLTVMSHGLCYDSCCHDLCRVNRVTTLIMTVCITRNIRVARPVLAAARKSQLRSSGGEKFLLLTVLVYGFALCRGPRV